MIKTKSLSVQIWLWFVGCIGISGIVIALIIYGSLEVYLKEQLFSDIEKQQQEIISLKSTTTKAAGQLAIPTSEAYSSTRVSHIVTTKQYIEIDPHKLVSAEAKPMTITTEGVIGNNGRYESKNVYYVISEEMIDDEKKYIYSYAVQNLRKEVLNRFWYVFLAIFIVILIMFLPAHLISKRITKPIKKLGSEMERIAKRKWKEPIVLKGSEEFISLAQSCESMRKQLITYDNKQQNMLQSISHELKTPIMVIRSYIEAAKDGFYPKGSLNTTLEAMEQEAIRLQKKVLDLIYITNLDYLNTHYKEIKQEEVNLKKVIEEVYERLQYRRTDVCWELDLKQILIRGDREQWKVVFENILQNGLRYSKNTIKISLKEEKDLAICRIYNNGEPIDEGKKDSLFNVFQKGNNGESGLGLNIVKRIVDLYDGDIWFENEEEGVSFYISIKIRRFKGMVLLKKKLLIL